MLLLYNGIYPSLQKVQCLTHLDAWQQLDGGEPQGDRLRRCLQSLLGHSISRRASGFTPSFAPWFPLSPDGDKQVQLTTRIFGGLNEVMRLGQAEKYSKNSINVGHHP